MYLKLRIPSTAPRRRRVAPFPAALTVVALLTHGCAGAPPSPFAGPDAADPSVAVPAVVYRSTLGRYVPQRPVEPAPWRPQNEQVAPPPKE